MAIAEPIDESGTTAATGRRAMQHPPQPAFHWRRGFALSVVSVTGQLLHTASLGDEGATKEACP